MGQFEILILTDGKYGEEAAKEAKASAARIAEDIPARMIVCGENTRECGEVLEDLRMKTHGSMLCLADSARLLAFCAENGFPAAGAVSGYNRNEDLSAAPYLLEEIGEIDPDSYVKIMQRLTGKPWEILRTGRCVVREMIPEDAGAIGKLYDAQAKRFLTAPSDDIASEEKIISSYIESVYSFYGYGMWSVLDRETGELIGKAGFEPYRSGEEGTQFGFLFAKERRGRGLAFEVCSALVRYGFEMCGFDRICAEAAADNAASAALLAKLGFRPFKEEGDMLYFCITSQ